MRQTGKFVFCARKKLFTVRSARLEKLSPPSPPHMKWDIFKHIFQILCALLAVARMTVFLRAEDLQRALHTFQSGTCAKLFLRVNFHTRSILLITRQKCHVPKCIFVWSNVNCSGFRLIYFTEMDVTRLVKY